MRVKREKAVKAPPDNKASTGKEEKDEPVVKGKGTPEQSLSPQEQWSDWIWSEERGLYYRAKKSSPGTAYLHNSSLHFSSRPALTKLFRNMEIRIRRTSINTGHLPHRTTTTPTLHLTKS
jgi:hypothetical protein